MAYTILQWPASVQRKEINELPEDAAVAILVWLRAMARNGPILEEYKTKRLSDHLHGLIQLNMKINKEQIRVLYFVRSTQIVIVHAFKKTSPQIETKGYEVALDRMNTAKQVLRDKNVLPFAIH